MQKAELYSQTNTLTQDKQLELVAFQGLKGNAQVVFLANPDDRQLSYFNNHK